MAAVTNVVSGGGHIALHWHWPSDHLVVVPRWRVTPPTHVDGRRRYGMHSFVHFFVFILGVRAGAVAAALDGVCRDGVHAEHL